MSKPLNCAIIIPCFNPDMAELSRAMSSIVVPLESSGHSATIILVDDQSSTVPPPKYDLLLERFPTAVLLNSLENGGPGAARNVGINHAVLELEAEVVGFLDADDEMSAEWPQALNRLSTQSWITVLTCGYLKNGQPFGTNQITRLSSWRVMPFTRISSIFVRTSYLRNSNIRFTHSRVGEDTEFIWHLIAAEGWQHFPTPVSKYNYDFKDHLVYPHPLYTSYENDPEFRQLLLNENLFEEVVHLNERNGLLLREILPWQARYMSFPSATFQYLLGAIARKSFKKLLWFFSLKV